MPLEAIATGILLVSKAISRQLFIFSIVKRNCVSISFIFHHILFIRPEIAELEQAIKKSTISKFQRTGWIFLIYWVLFIFIYFSPKVQELLLFVFGKWPLVGAIFEFSQNENELPKCCFYFNGRLKFLVKIF